MKKIQIFLIATITAMILCACGSKDKRVNTEITAQSNTQGNYDEGSKEQPAEMGDNTTEIYDNELADKIKNLDASTVEKSGTCGDDLSWFFKDGVLVIRGIGIMILSPVPWKDFAEDIQTVIIEKGCTSIADTAFWGSGVKEVYIPDSVTAIRKYAFHSCKNLENIVIPAGVTTIGEGAFQACTNLTNVTLPDGLESIGASAFASCKKLNNVVIPDSVTEMDFAIFEDCEQLTNITLTPGIKEVEMRMFSRCVNLENIGIPEGIEKIETCAFDECENLKEISLPNSLLSIGDGAFQNCSSLSSITIPSSVKSVDSAFRNCTGLQEIVVESEDTELTNFACPEGTKVVIAGKEYTYDGMFKYRNE